MRDFEFQWSQATKLQFKEPLKDHNVDSIVLFWLYIVSDTAISWVSKKKQ